MSKPSEASNRKGGLISLRRMARLRPAALWAQALYGLIEAGAPLDVYKRQIVEMAGSDEVYANPMHPYTPVSYTHLDVYKRQPPS